MATPRERTWFRPGTRVVVKAHPRSGARTVVAVYDPDIAGGRRLDHPVHGFVSWNVMDLRKATPQETR